VLQTQPAFAAAAITLLLAAAALLWGLYGATLFFETIRTGFAVCFG